MLKPAADQRAKHQCPKLEIWQSIATSRPRVVPRQTACPLATSGLVTSGMSQLNQEEFASEFRDAYTRLWTVAVAVLGNRSQADDVVQEAAITGLRRLADFERGSNFVGWMGQIVRFTALNHRKQKKRRNTTADSLHLVTAPQDETSLTYADDVLTDGQLKSDQRLFDDSTAQAISNLEPDRRACLLLRIVHNLTYDEIASIVGVPEGTAMSHVHRAKSFLRQALTATQPDRESSHGSYTHH